MAGSLEVGSPVTGRFALRGLLSPWNGGGPLVRINRGSQPASATGQLLAPAASCVSSPKLPAGARGGPDLAGVPGFPQEVPGSQLWAPHPTLTSLPGR